MATVGVIIVVTLNITLLLVQMFAWPMLIAILLLALALGYRRVFGGE
jgi:hypothetical protein